ncbi:hypothetical protein KDA_13660 [Dictyobacter alpinus]|uniref:Peptidase S1 domain-containing protein n=1 Tax=Dictyobacter alpinus TaxID=2014873 RepID=A0A402B3F4_9CHLR|nr:serine protease [Dictyobacter alpinus]GCE25882.1 hypothetical protein KDA_13660 [Dictyobacter alpinus]
MQRYKLIILFIEMYVQIGMLRLLYINGEQEVIMCNTRFIALFLSAKSKKLFLFSALVLLSIFSIFVAPGQAFAEATPGGNITNPVVRAVDIAKPAVVRIITTLGGRLNVNFTNDQSATFPLNGGYYDLKLSGSGTFISSHGDILTADHVIQPPHDKSMDDVLQMTAAKDVANYINQTFHPDTPYTEEDAYTNMYYGVFRTTSTYNKPASEVYLSKDYAGVINATKLSEVPQNFHAPVNQIKKESGVDERDVAIIHVDMEDTPSVHLGDSSNVSQQDELTVIGFPGNGDLGDPLTPDPNAYLTSSVNKIYVSSIKTASGGGQVIQVGGNVEHGDSGGPALDGQGNIVGVVSFYNQFAQAPIGTSFLQASNSANQLLTGLNLDLKPGKFQQSWEEAFKSYTATGSNHWHRAYADFRKLQQAYPDFQAVSPFMDYTSSQSLHEKLPTSTQPDNHLTPLIMSLIVIAVIIILLAAPGWFFWSRSRRSKSQLAYQTHAQPATNGSAYPSMPPAGYAGYNGNGYSGNGAQPQSALSANNQQQEATPARVMEFESQQVPQTPAPAASWQSAQWPYPTAAVENAETARSTNESPIRQLPFEGSSSSPENVQEHLTQREGNGRDYLATNGVRAENFNQWPVEIPHEQTARGDVQFMANPAAVPTTASENEHVMANIHVQSTQKSPRVQIPSENGAAHPNDASVPPQLIDKN